MLADDRSSYRGTEHRSVMDATNFQVTIDVEHLKQLWGAGFTGLWTITAWQNHTVALLSHEVGSTFVNRVDIGIHILA